MIAIIPARLESKRFPRKVLAMCGGQTLLQRAISTALESNLFSAVVVSSASAEVLDLATAAGAVAWLRMPNTSAYEARVPDVCREVLEAKLFDQHSAFALLLATSPLRTPEMLQQAYRQFRLGDEHCLMSVVEYDHPPQWALHADNGLIVPAFGSRALNTTPKPLYRHDGTVIFAKRETFLRAGDFYPLGPAAFEIGREESCDINTPLDLAWAEFLLQRRGG